VHGSAGKMALQELQELDEIFAEKRRLSIRDSDF
jgi:hypothetical protein